MLEYNYFKDYIKNNLVYSMPKKINGLSFQEVNSGNKSLHVLRKGQPYVKINMEDIYQQYKDGKDIEDLLKSTAKTIYNHIKPPVDIGMKNAILDHIYIGLLEEDILNENTIREEFLDYAVVYMIIRNNDGISKINEVAEDFLEDYEITIDELRCVAMLNTLRKNSPQIYTVNIDEIKINEIPIISDNESIIRDDIMHCVVSSKCGVLGAASILFDSVIDRLTEIMGGNFYMIPINPNEIHILKDDEIALYNFLHSLKIQRKIFKDPNMFKNRVYRYNSVNDAFETIIEQED